MFEEYPENLQRLLTFAHAAAKVARADEIGSEHLLAAAISEDPDFAHHCGADDLVGAATKLRKQFEEEGILQHIGAKATIALSETAKLILNFAENESHRNFEKQVTAQHIFIAIAKAQQGLGAGILKARGIDLFSARNKAKELTPPPAAVAMPLPVMAVTALQEGPQTIQSILGRLCPAPQVDWSKPLEKPIGPGIRAPRKAATETADESQGSNVTDEFRALMERAVYQRRPAVAASLETPIAPPKAEALAAEATHDEEPVVMPLDDLERQRRDDFLSHFQAVPPNEVKIGKVVVPAEWAAKPERPQDTKMANTDAPNKAVLSQRI